MEHDGPMLPEKTADTYFHLAQQHQSTGRLWWNH